MVNVNLIMHNILTKLSAFILNLLLRFICSSNKLSTTRLDIFERWAEEGNNIFAFWHSRLFYLAYYSIKNAKKPKISVLISMSRDGDYGVAMGRKLGQDVVRGSTSRGGHKAIRDLARKAAAGNNIAITPDGPRGPACRVNEGVIRLAQLTRARIIPVSYDATRKKKLKSWDGFIIVKPFGRVHMAFAEPVQVPRDLDSGEVEKYREELEKTLLELDQICAEKLGLNKGQ
ncbi:MAG: lysophospholipid acyltransferase family protein [Planctomycetota bacterium]|jgi:lysophospholipid acyltransferase (LPLAT)-like uncharacterized protein